MRISDWSSDVCSSDLTERGYDKPLFFNSQADGADQFTETIFFARSVPLLRFDFGFSDGGRDIGHEIGERMGPSLALAQPTFVLGLFVCIPFALMLVCFKGTRQIGRAHV